MPVKSSGKWKVSRISSGVFPSIIRASALEVRSTRLFIPSASAALVSSHSLRVSSRINLSSNNFRSCNDRQHNISGDTAMRAGYAPNLVGAACSAVKAYILDYEAEHLRPDLRRGAERLTSCPGDMLACSTHLLRKLQRRLVSGAGAVE